MGWKFLRLGTAILGCLLVGCSTPSLRSISVTPTAGTEVLSSAGQTVQYKAIGSYQQGTHAPTTEDITNAVTWSSSNTAVATISSTGVVTAIGSGNATITATGSGASGILSGSSDVTVTLSSVNAARTLSSMSIIGSQPVANVGETLQLIAIGSFNSAPLTQDLTSQVTWASSDIYVGKVDATGLVTAISPGSTTISALYTPPATTAVPNPATIVATSSFSLGSGSGANTLDTLAIYKVGVNASSGSVTGTYILAGTNTVVQAISCGPGATVAKCTAYAPPGTVITLTTTTHAGFGGWSSDCSVSATDPYTCTITLPAVSPAGSIGNVTVGTIFD